MENNGASGTQIAGTVRPDHYSDGTLMDVLRSYNNAKKCIEQLEELSRAKYPCLVIGYRQSVTATIT